MIPPIQSKIEAEKSCLDWFCCFGTQTIIYTDKQKPQKSDSFSETEEKTTTVYKHTIHHSKANNVQKNNCNTSEN